MPNIRTCGNITESRVLQGDQPLNISEWLATIPSTLCTGCFAEIEKRSSDVERSGGWPRESLQLLATHGVLKGLISELRGGEGWDGPQQLAAYFQLAKSCMTTAFILTQWHAAIRRLEIHANGEVWGQWGAGVVSGKVWTTVGFSHLTTSRQHLQTPPLLASRIGSTYQLNGYCPWVTGGAFADFIVVGSLTDEGSQILSVVETQAPGVNAGKGQELMGLSASCTDRVDFQNVMIRDEYLLAGPVEQVLKIGSGGPGGLHTSILALGLASRAIDYLQEQSLNRADFVEPAQELQQDLERLISEMLVLAVGQKGISLDQLRQQANSLALRATQAAMAAAKGAGYVAQHPVGRWCREAMFFLVWSCPQSVVRSQVCELAGLT
jgi:alkylation response protein AidB-like acyl-CoA dehydrogenase